jgi:hypothetical protein
VSEVVTKPTRDHERRKSEAALPATTRIPSRIIANRLVDKIWPPKHSEHSSALNLRCCMPPAPKKATPAERFELVEACRLASPEALEWLLRLIRESNNGAAISRACEAILAYGFGRPQTNVRVEKVTDGAGERIRILDII